MIYSFSYYFWYKDAIEGSSEINNKTELYVLADEMLIAKKNGQW
jgi:hypothetical protein